MTGVQYSCIELGMQRETRWRLFLILKADVDTIFKKQLDDIVLGPRPKGEVCYQGIKF